MKTGGGASVRKAGWEIERERAASRFHRCSEVVSCCCCVAEIFWFNNTSEGDGEEHSRRHHSSGGGCSLICNCSIRKVEGWWEEREQMEHVEAAQWVSLNPKSVSAPPSRDIHIVITTLVPPGRPGREGRSLVSLGLLYPKDSQHRVLVLISAT